MLSLPHLPPPPFPLPPFNCTLSHFLSSLKFCPAQPLFPPLPPSSLRLWIFSQPGTQLLSLLPLPLPLPLPPPFVGARSSCVVSLELSCNCFVSFRFVSFRFALFCSVLCFFVLFTLVDPPPFFDGGSQPTKSSGLLAPTANLTGCYLGTPAGIITLTWCWGFKLRIIHPW